MTAGNQKPGFTRLSPLFIAGLGIEKHNKCKLEDTLHIYKHLNWIEEVNANACFKALY